MNLLVFSRSLPRGRKNLGVRLFSSFEIIPLSEDKKERGRGYPNRKDVRDNWHEKSYQSGHHNRRGGEPCVERKVHKTGNESPHDEVGQPPTQQTDENTWYTEIDCLNILLINFHTDL